MCIFYLSHNTMVFIFTCFILHINFSLSLSLSLSRQTSIVQYIEEKTGYNPIDILDVCKLWMDDKVYIHLNLKQSIFQRIIYFQVTRMNNKIPNQKTKAQKNFS